MGWIGIHTGANPADANGAGGPNDVVETVNESFGIFSRQPFGGLQYQNTLQAWFNTNGSSRAGLFDPHVVYDALTGRYFMLADAGDSIWLSVSKQSAGIGNWCDYRFSGPASGAWSSSQFADLPLIGVTDNFINISVNIFDGSPDNPGGGNSSRILTLTKSSLEACGATNWGYWYNLFDPGTGAFGTNIGAQPAFSISPALQWSSAAAGYLVDSYSYGGCAVTQWTMTGGSIFNVGMVGNRVSTPCYVAPPLAPQAGSTIPLNTLDSRVAQVSYLNGSLGFALSGAYNWGCDGNDAVIWWFNLNPTTATVSSQGGFGYPCVAYFYPSMQMINNGHWGISFDYSGRSIYPSAALEGFTANGSPEGAIVVANGSGPDVAFPVNCGGVTCARWGDFSSARLDPINYVGIWTVGEFTASTNMWGTQIAGISV